MMIATFSISDRNWSGIASSASATSASKASVSIGSMVATLPAIGTRELAARQLVATGRLPVASPAVPEPGTPMTDFLDESFSIPAPLGVVAEVRDGEFRLSLHPRPQLLRHGALRASVIAFMIDVVAGIVLDDDPDAWMLTSDLSVRMRPLPAPQYLTTRSTILRRGGGAAAGPGGGGAAE